jgi:hypothetical protein
LKLRNTFETTKPPEDLGGCREALDYLIFFNKIKHVKV